MNKLLTILLVVFLFYGCTSETNEHPILKDGMLVHISHGSDDTQRALMGLSLAAKISVEKPVLVFLDITGPEIVLKDATAFEGPEYGQTADLIAQLQENKAQIIVCPMCLEKMKKTKEDLIAGVTLAQKESFFDFTDGRIITLDY